jgi:hypothetical protein
MRLRIPIVISCRPNGKIGKDRIEWMKWAKSAFLALPFLGGCGLIPGDKAPEAAEDGSRTYSMVSLYDGEVGSKDRAAAALDIDARNLCGADYTLLSEESRPIMNRIGEVTSSRLVWEIRCLPQPGSPPAR